MSPGFAARAGNTYNYSNYFFLKSLPPMGGEGKWFNKYPNYDLKHKRKIL